MTRKLNQTKRVVLPVVFGAIFICGIIASEAKEEGISLTNMQAASEELEEQFTSKGFDQLDKLSNSDDTTVAIHATWEIAKGEPAKREEFLKKLESEMKVEPPKWWKGLVRGIKIYEGNCHYVPGVKLLDEDADFRLLHRGYQIVAKPEVAGFSYRIAITDLSTKKETLITVWAAGRDVLGGVGVHQMEMMAVDDTLCVFGAESHGAYAEKFQLADGKPLFRFSTCYWFNFSEKWEWKPKVAPLRTEQGAPDSAEEN